MSKKSKAPALASAISLPDSIMWRSMAANGTWMYGPRMGPEFGEDADEVPRFDVEFLYTAAEVNAIVQSHVSPLQEKVAHLGSVVEDQKNTIAALTLGCEKYGLTETTPIVRRLDQLEAERDDLTSKLAAKDEELARWKLQSEDWQKRGWVLGSQIDASEELVDKLVESLEWYVKNDDVNEGQPGNEFWVEGLNRARRLLEQVRLSKAIPPSETKAKPARM